MPTKESAISESRVAGAKGMNSVRSRRLLSQSFTLASEQW